MRKLIIISFTLLGLGILWISFIVTRAKAESVSIGAKVPVTKDNCIQAYKENRDCIDQCIY